MAPLVGTQVRRTGWEWGRGGSACPAWCVWGCCCWRWDGPGRRPRRTQGLRTCSELRADVGGTPGSTPAFTPKPADSLATSPRTASGRRASRFGEGGLLGSESRAPSSTGARSLRSIFLGEAAFLSLQQRHHTPESRRLETGLDGGVPGEGACTSPPPSTSVCPARPQPPARSVEPHMPGPSASREAPGGLAMFDLPDCSPATAARGAWATGRMPGAGHAGVPVCRRAMLPALFWGSLLQSKARARGERRPCHANPTHPRPCFRRFPRHLHARRPGRTGVPEPHPPPDPVGFEYDVATQAGGATASQDAWAGALGGGGGGVPCWSGAEWVETDGRAGLGTRDAGPLRVQCSGQGMPHHAGMLLVLGLP